MAFIIWIGPVCDGMPDFSISRQIPPLPRCYNGREKGGDKP